MTVILAFLTACAFSLPLDVIEAGEIGARMPGGTFPEKLTAFLPSLGERMFPASVLLFVVFFLIYRTLLKRIRPKQFSVAALLTGSLFAVYLLTGECAEKYWDLRVLWQNVPQCLISLLKLAGWIPFFYVGIRAGYAALDERKQKPVSGWLGETVFGKHSYLFPLLILLLCWLPYVIAFFPGFIPSDGLKQLNNFFGSGNFTDNHPAFSTMLMGWAMRLGRQLGSDNLGIFFFTGPQLLITAAVMAACFPLYKELHTPLWLRGLTLGMFALIPVWPNYAFSLLKDSLYMAMILYFVIQLIRISRDASGYCGKRLNLVLLTAALCLMMMVRHEGQYVGGLIFLSLFTLPSARKQWKRLLPVILIPLLCINVFNRVIRPKMRIPDAPAREALTMPFRQTSAVVLEAEDSLTEEQSAVLHELFVYDKISLTFSLENADPLKGQFTPKAKRQDILRYMKAWAELGLKHPLLYLNVFLCSNFRYFDPFTRPYADIYGWFGIVQETYVNKGVFDISYRDSTAVLRSVLTNIASGLPGLPLSSLFYSLGANAWLMIFCLSALLRKKVHGVVIPLLPGMVTFFLLQNSAVNGFFRYMLPLLISLPVCFAWTLAQKDREDPQ